MSEGAVDLAQGGDGSGAVPGGDAGGAVVGGVPGAGEGAALGLGADSGAGGQGAPDQARAESSSGSLVDDLFGGKPGDQAADRGGDRGGEAAAQSGGDNAEGARPGLSQDLLDGLATDQRAWLENKGWHRDGKTFADVVEGYRNLERRLGGSPVTDLLVPGDWSDADQVARFNQSVGVPKDASEYPVVEAKISSGETIDPGIAAAMSHRLGLRPDQHEGLVTGIAELINATQAAEQQALQANVRSAEAAIDRDLGAKAQEYRQDIRRAWAAFPSLKEAQRTMSAAPDASAARAAMDLVAEIGRAVSETRLVQAGDGPGGTSPDVARARMDALKGDKAFQKRMADGDSKALQEWRELLDVVYPPGQGG
jgi:hypothetical protein